MVALMRRYVIDYTNSHDQSIYPEIFVDDYRVHINGLELVRDHSYGPLTAALFAAAPGLGLVVHELVLNGDRLCMRFSEHAAMPDRETGDRVLTCWSGIGLYRWDGSRFTENHVEQDFQSRRRQLRTRQPDELEPPHIDPWMTTQPVAADPQAEQAAHRFLEAGRFTDASEVIIDDQRDRNAGLVVVPDTVVVNDLFSAGHTVAVHATVAGEYRGGVFDVGEDLIGTRVELQVAALLRVGGDGAVEQVRAVTARDAVRTQLRSRT